MEFLFDFIMELVPDAFTELIGDRCFGFIKSHVENKLLRGLLFGVIIMILAALGVGLAFCIILLIGSVFCR